jgi:SpoVK/Ycf46/Vps4 family AAA+-type ATPase
VTESFLTPEAEKNYGKQGFLYKRSFLFFGPPGTGKSVLASKISDIAVARKDAVVLYPVCYEALERMLQVLDSTDKDRFKVIVLEEFDSLIHKHDTSMWTTLLDGQFQSANRLLVATTNSVECIPSRLLRPGRFSSIVLIPPLDMRARETFLVAKGVTQSLANAIVEATDGFTVDDLKEVIQACFLLGEDVKTAVESIRATKMLGHSNAD